MCGFDSRLQHNNFLLLGLIKYFQILLLSSFCFTQSNDNIAKLLKNGDYASAKEAIDLIIINGSNNPEDYELASKIYIKTDDLTRGNEYINKAIELDPRNEIYREQWELLNDMKSRINEAQKSFDNGFPDESILNYENMIKKYPDFSLGYYNFGLTYYKLENYDLAIEKFQRASNLNPFEEKYKSAITNIAAKLTQKGNEEYRRRDFNQALEYYKKAVTFSPKFSEARFKSALILNKLGDYDNAKITLLNNIEIDSMHIQSYKLLGDVYTRLGILDSAIIWYQNATRINSNYDKAFYSLGKTYINLGKFEEAEGSLKQAVLVNPSYSKAYESLGYIYSAKEDFNSAINNYLLAIEHDYRSYEAYSRLASSYNALKEFEKARKSAKDSIELKKNNPSANFELGVAEKGLGNIVAAKSAFEIASKDKRWRKISRYELTMIEKGY